MKASKHILFLTPGFAGDENDTACLPYFQNYLHALIQAKPNLVISVLAFQFPFKDSEYHWHGIRVVSLGGANKKYYSKIKLWSKARRFIGTLHKDHPIDIIHSLWLTECAFVGGSMARKLNIFHVCTAMGTDVLKKNSYLYLINFKQLKVVAVSDFQKKTLHKSKSKIESITIPWGVKKMVIEKTPLADRPIDVLGVGSLIELKNYREFISVVNTLAKKNDQLNVVIIGVGPQLNQLKEQVVTYGLPSQIQFLGKKTNEEVQTAMQSAKVLLHLSTFESQGYVFLEALANGMKIVSRRVGIAEESDRWLIVENGSDAADILMKALLNFESKSIAPYPIEDTVSAYCDLYDQGKM